MGKVPFICLGIPRQQSVPDLAQAPSKPSPSMDFDIYTGSIKLGFRVRDLVDPGLRRPIPDPVQGVQVPCAGVPGQDDIDVAPLITAHREDTPLGREELLSLLGDGAAVSLVASPVIEDGLGKKFASLVSSCSGAIPRVVNGEEGIGGTRGSSPVNGYNATVIWFSRAELGEGNVSVFLVPESDGFPGSSGESGTVSCLVRSVLAVCAHAVPGEDLMLTSSAIGRNQV